MQFKSVEKNVFFYVTQTWSILGEIQHNCSKLKISASILFWSFPLSISANKSNNILRREWNSFFMTNLVAFLMIVWHLQVLQVSKCNTEASLCVKDT